jgi:DNA polymerase phi
MFAPSLRDALLATLAPTSEPPLNATQAKDLLKLASQAVRQSKRIESSDLSTMWKSDAWEDLRSQLAASDRFKASTGLLNSCKQIVQMTSGSSTKAVGEGDSLPERGSATKTAKSTKPGKRKAEDSGAKQVEGKSKAKKVKKA